MGRKKVEERFWEKVDQTPGLGFSKEYPDCWEWFGRKRDGYGTFIYQGREIRTHRFSYLIHKGEIPENLLVRHKCDNKKCVKPNHLEVGTHQDNMDDIRKSSNYINGRVKTHIKIENTHADTLIPEYIDVTCSNDDKTYQILKTEYVYKMARGIKEFFHNDECYKEYISKQADSLLEERFWSRVEKGNKDDCWTWTGVHRKNKLGKPKQGIIKFKNETLSVNRLSYEFIKGKIPEDLVVLQSCLNDLCVNPDHLYLGDHSSEARLLANTYLVKLTPNQCKQIIKLYMDGYTIYELAEKFGVGIATISKLINSKYKSIISSPIKDKNYSKGEDRYNTELTADIIINIKKDWDLNKLKIVQIMEKYDMLKPTVSNIIYRRNWAHIEYPGSLWKDGIYLGEGSLPKRTNAILFEYNGVRYTLNQLYVFCNKSITRGTLRYRLRSGMPIEQALT